MAKVAPGEEVAGPVKGKSLFVNSPSGRKIEYCFLGRCELDDPFLLVLHGGLGPSWMFGTACSSIHLTRKGKKGENKETTQKVVEELPFKIVGVARPGYGASTLNKPANQMTYEDACVDFIAVMDAAGASKFSIIANSSGGMHALTIAYAHPDRVVAIQLNCCDANYAPGYPKGKKANAALTEGEAISYVDGNARPGGPVHLCCCRNPCCCCCCYCWPSGFISDMYSEIRTVPYKLECIKCPVQIIAGEKDDTVDTNTSRFHASKLPNSSLSIVEGMGHCQMPADVFDVKMSEFHKLAIGTQEAPAQACMK